MNESLFLPCSLQSCAILSTLSGARGAKQLVVVKIHTILCAPSSSIHDSIFAISVSTRSSVCTQSTIIGTCIVINSNREERKKERKKERKECRNMKI